MTRAVVTLLLVTVAYFKLHSTRARKAVSYVDTKRMHRIVWHLQLLIRIQ